MGYDPREHGADCDNCPLNKKRCVPPEWGSNINDLTLITGKAIALVGEAPGAEEEKHGRPFVGKSGYELDFALRKASIKRSDCLTTNTLLCRPPDNDLKRMLTLINKHNRKLNKEWRKAKKEAEKNGDPVPEEPEYTKSPLDCCRPRLEKEIRNFSNFITLGKTATRAVTGSKASIMKTRGGLMDLEATMDTPSRRVMPTIHPALCLRQPRWFPAFRNDVYKAGRWFREEVTWEDPPTNHQPTLEEWYDFLRRKGDRVLAYDLETDGIECLTAKIRCVGIGDTEEVMMFYFLSKDGVTDTGLSPCGSFEFYPPGMREKVRDALIEFFESEEYTKFTWNGFKYDQPVLKAQWGCEVKNEIDGILMHRNIESELPHSLAYVVSMYEYAPSWKTDREDNKLATDAESDYELGKYCSRDVVLSARVLTPLVEKLKLRNQVEVFKADSAVQKVCASMHRTGMYVDQAKRLEVEKSLMSRRHQLLSEIRDILEIPDFNPGSVYQVRDILFDRWDLESVLANHLGEKDRLTKSRDPSTSDLVLRTLLMDGTVREDRRYLIKLLRYYRKVQKILGTYVVKLRPWNMVIGAEVEDVGWDEDDDWVDKETRKRYGEKKRGIVNPYTGRMYPGWSSSVAVTGRLSSSKPINAMNFPKKLRGMVTAAKGNVLVGADADQLEVRVAASLWQIQKYLHAFAEGKDPHSMTTYLIFGEVFCQAAGVDSSLFDRPGKLVGTAYDENGTFIGKGKAKELRDLSKNVMFASQYMAAVEKVHQMVQSTEVERPDGTTELPYAKLPLRQIREMHKKWLAGAPEYNKGWQDVIDEFKRQGYLRGPLCGRRRDFLDSHGDDIEANEIVNYLVQCTAAAHMNRAILDIADQIPEGKWGPGTGIINQCHDHIVVECPEDKAEEVGNIIEEAMNVEYKELPGVKLTASADIGNAWDEV